MNEDEWLTSTDVDRMHRFVRQSRHERKLRLFAAACCRRVWHLLVHQVSRDAVEVGERFADGQATDGERDDAYQQADDLWHLLGDAFEEWSLEETPEYARAILDAGLHPFAAAEAAEAPLGVLDASLDGLAAHRVIGSAIGWTNASDIRDPRAEADEQAAQAELLRDVFGPLLYRPASLPGAVHAWEGGVVTRLAQAAYDERHLPGGELDEQRLAVLADALEDTGLVDDALLSHLRSPGPHVRGCWAVDLVLGKG